MEMDPSKPTISTIIKGMFDSLDPLLQSKNIEYSTFAKQVEKTALNVLTSNASSLSIKDLDSLSFSMKQLLKSYVGDETESKISSQFPKAIRDFQMNQANATKPIAWDNLDAGTKNLLSLLQANLQVVTNRITNSYPITEKHTYRFFKAIKELTGKESPLDILNSRELPFYLNKEDISSLQHILLYLELAKEETDLNPSTALEIIYQIGTLGQIKKSPNPSLNDSFQYSKQELEALEKKLINQLH